jgi:hypothetical protein
MNISRKITTSLWIASKSLAFIGILLCFFPWAMGFLISGNSFARYFPCYA